GELTSKPFPLDGARYVKVSFRFWREVEPYDGAYDQTYVQVRFDSGEWKTAWYRDAKTPSEKVWTAVETEGIAVPTGATTLQVRFVFDSVDRFNNKYIGWLVDEVRVVKSETGRALALLELPTPPSREASKPEVMVSPNPVRDVHTAVFSVRGVEAEALRVEVYDLAGRLVWAGEVLGNELIWHTQDLAGHFLANGVYFYRAYVQMVTGDIIVAVGKVAILR
ncbi:MAG: T9SS type A sorting domain-containing protein, partial [Candidatus Bipolaricaulaceae bacterium]